MAKGLKDKYGDNYHFRQLYDTELLRVDNGDKDIEPLRIDEIKIGEKVYKASYFGIEEINYKNFASKEFWRIKDSYENFKDNPTNGNVLPYNNFPMFIELEEVFKVIVILDDGSEKVGYYRSDGEFWRGLETTTEFLISQYYFCENSFIYITCQ